MAEFPALAGLLVPGGETAGGPDSFPPEIEEEANNNFQVCCAHTLGSAHRAHPKMTCTHGVCMGGHQKGSMHGSMPLRVQSRC
jgi:hypothetical protein